MIRKNIVIKLWYHGYCCLGKARNSQSESIWGKKCKIMQMILKHLSVLYLVNYIPFQSSVQSYMDAVEKETKINEFHRVIADETWPWPLYFFKSARKLKKSKVDLYFFYLENHHFLFRSVLLEAGGSKMGTVNQEWERQGENWKGRGSRADAGH